MTRILAVVNQKGGVGKTTTTLNLGLVLARQCRVLLVDLDPQASLTSFLGFDPYHLERSSYSVLMFEEMGLSRVMKTVSSSLALLPASVDLATAAIKMTQEPHPLGRLRTALRASPIAFDYVLIDTPPSINVLTVVGMLAADEILIPAQCNHTAVYGIRAVQEVVKRIRENLGNPELKIRGILPTFYDTEAVYGQKVLEELKALFAGQVFNTPIPYDVHVSDAPHRSKAVVDYAPGSPGAAAYRQLGQEISAD